MGATISSFMFDWHISSVEAYLSVNSSKCAKRLKGKDNNNLGLATLLWWDSPSQSMYPQQERRFYMLTFHKTLRECITEGYLQDMIREGKEIEVRNRQRKRFTNSPPGYKWPSRQAMWSEIVFEDPATFEAMALETEKKEEIIKDLITFSESKDRYSRIGRVWKRGYLLHGPPGTGKSMMIAAMSNLLNYDVYDLKLTAVKDDAELRELFFETTSKSIIVIEDIDCFLDLTRKEEGSCSSKVTLLGLSHIIDGLLSGCLRERLIVLTTNNAQKLDPRLIRSGRIDMQIELSYCSFEAFKMLARNYLKIDSHAMFDTIQGLMKETEITPADVAENLMPKSPLDNPDNCLSNLIQALVEAKEAQADKEKEAKSGKLGYAEPEQPSIQLQDGNRNL